MKVNMSSTTVQNLVIGGIIVGYAAFMFWLGWLAGNSAGFAKGLDWDNKFECQGKFHGKPLSEVSTECLKYFERE